MTGLVRKTRRIDMERNFTEWFDGSMHPLKKCFGVVGWRSDSNE